jgi:hypothetical protein
MAAMRKLPVVLLCRTCQPLLKTGNNSIFGNVLPRHEGRSAIVTTREAGCDGRVVPQDERR